MVRPRGSVALVGMPGKVTIDLAPLWHREVRLAGAYAYGTESDRRRLGPAPAVAVGGRKSAAAPPKEVSTFELSFEVVAAESTGSLVSATYPLARFEEAVAHAGAAGRRGAVKIAFDIAKGRTR